MVISVPHFNPAAPLRFEAENSGAGAPPLPPSPSIQQGSAQFLAGISLAGLGNYASNRFLTSFAQSIPGLTRSLPGLLPVNLKLVVGLGLAALALGGSHAFTTGIKEQGGSTYALNMIGGVLGGLLGGVFSAVWKGLLVKGIVDVGVTSYLMHAGLSLGHFVVSRDSQQLNQALFTREALWGSLTLGLFHYSNRGVAQWNNNLIRQGRGLDSSILWGLGTSLGLSADYGIQNLAGRTQGGWFHHVTRGVNELGAFHLGMSSLKYRNLSGRLENWARGHRQSIKTAATVAAAASAGVGVAATVIGPKKPEGVKPLNDRVANAVRRYSLKCLDAQENILFANAVFETMKHQGRHIGFATDMYHLSQLGSKRDCIRHFEELRRNPNPPPQTPSKPMPPLINLCEKLLPDLPTPSRTYHSSLDGKVFDRIGLVAATMAKSGDRYGAGQLLLRAKRYGRSFPNPKQVIESEWPRLNAIEWYCARDEVMPTMQVLPNMQRDHGTRARDIHLRAIIPNEIDAIQFAKKQVNLPKLMPIHPPFYAFPYTIHSIRSFMIFRLRCMGWQPGETPSAEMLKEILLSNGEGNPKSTNSIVGKGYEDLPFVSELPNGFHLINNGTHRLIALASLVADGVPFSGWTAEAIPVSLTPMRTSGFLRGLRQVSGLADISWPEMTRHLPKTKAWFEERGLTMNLRDIVKEP